jgi:hypothetical protein
VSIFRIFRPGCTTPYAATRQSHIWTDGEVLGHVAVDVSFST